jgi:hypothetical protein
MSSRLILNLVLLIGVVTLSLYIMLTPEPTSPPAKPKLTDLPADTIDHITIRHGQAPETVLQKQNGQWRLIKPVNMSANDYQVHKLVQLTEILSQSHYPAQSDKLAAMGLNKPAVTLTLNNISIKFGGTEPINKYRYVLLDNTVHLIVDAVSHILLQAPASLGNTALLPQHQAITRLDLPDFTLSKDSEGNWRIEGAKDENLSQDDLVAFIDDWRFAEALHISFVDKLSKAERSLPRVTMTLKGETTPLSFYLDTRGDHFTLTREDPGVRYHFIKDKQQTLLSLPRPEPPSPATD